jgi:hypothetical protein
MKLISIAIFFSVLNTNAHAYIDPGLGSIILQGIIGAIAAVSFTVKIYWQKIKSFFNKFKKKSLD